MELTEYSRRLDNSGRLVIPIKLREQLGMQAGQEYSFFIHEQDDKRYLCIECPTPELSMQDVEAYLAKKGLTITPKN